MSDADEFERRIARLDQSLFDLVQTQSTARDKISWLTIQRTVRRTKPVYTYLEIGSYLGGSLQQYLQDPRCTTIYSIDDRTVDGRHRENSTEAMLDGLAVVGDALHKLHCFDGDACDVSPTAISTAPDVCFIDGRHTDEAVANDFSFCLSVCAADAVIYFHDAGRTRSGIAFCLGSLTRSGRPHLAYKLPGETFVIALLSSPLCADASVRSLAVATHGGLWLRTAGLANGVRRHTPPQFKPALGRLRRLFWRAGSD